MTDKEIEEVKCQVCGRTYKTIIEQGIGFYTDRNGNELCNSCKGICERGDCGLVKIIKHNQNAKAVEALQRVKDNIHLLYTLGYLTMSNIDNEINKLLKEYGGGERIMIIMLGNLSVDEIEERLGVKFTKKIKDFLNSTRQQKAEDIEKNKWHCFDLPFVIQCGSYELATKIFNMLIQYHEDAKERIGICW